VSLLKIGAVIVAGIVLFVVLGHVVSFLIGLVTTLAFLAIIAGGGYVAYRVLSGGRRRELR
jgi:hypothetical protein